MALKLNKFMILRNIEKLNFKIDFSCLTFKLRGKLPKIYKFEKYL